MRSQQYYKTLKKKYDVIPLLEKEMFIPLKNPALFNTVQVEQAGQTMPAITSPTGVMNVNFYENEKV